MGETTAARAKYRELVVSVSQARAHHPRSAAGKITTNAGNEFNSATSELDAAEMEQERLMMMTSLI